MTHRHYVRYENFLSVLLVCLKRKDVETAFAAGISDVRLIFVFNVVPITTAPTLHPDPT